MRYKRPELAAQFESETEAELRDLLLRFAAASPRFGLPEPLLTCLGRTAAENKAAGGVPTSLHLWEVDVQGNRLPARAADLSLRPYDGTQVGLAETWLRMETALLGGKKRWEWLKHDVGSGMHFHIGRKRVP